MEDYIQKLKEDLGKKLEHLGWMCFDPARRLADHFEELRRTVDYEAEVLIRKISENLLDKDVNKVNKTRLEFIRILEELETRFFAPKTATTIERDDDCSADESYRSFEKRVDEFMKSSEISPLGDLEDSYLQLAQEILDESDRLERGLCGEQTIIYWPHKRQDDLGSLVYFGDLFLGQREIDSLYIRAFPSRRQSPNFALLVPSNKPPCLSKKVQVIEKLGEQIFRKFAEAPKFWYIGKSESEYAGFSAKGLSVQRQFLSYQFHSTENELFNRGDVDFDTSANLFDVYSAKMCTISLHNLRMENLNVNLLPLPLERLVSLSLSNVHLRSIDTNLLAKLTHLVDLKLQATFSKEFEFDLGFLRSLKNLSSLYLALPNSPSDLSMLEELSVLRSLNLESSSFLFAREKLPQLTETALKQILSPPRLQSLKLSFFRIEVLDHAILSSMRVTIALDLTSCQIGNIEAFLNPAEITNQDTDDLAFRFFTRIICLRLIDVGVRALCATSFATELCNLSDLSLAGNSIVELPRGVFCGLQGLRNLNLSRNRIRRLNNGLFCGSCRLTVLTFDENPIGSIEACAFVELSGLKTLSLVGCRLKSIDSEIFIGLTSLRTLVLNNNLIERIEVVVEDEERRWVNVAKADFGNDDRELVNNRLFKDLFCLQRLFLSKNKLASIDLSCFSDLESLLELDLSSNQITKLTGTAEPGLLPRLETLNLKDNPLKVGAKESFPKCTKFDRNQLSDSCCVQNNRKTIGLNVTQALDDPNIFSNRTYFSNINLSGSGLNRIHRDIFKCLTSLTWCDLSSNRLASIDLGLFRGPDHRLVHLDLSSNNISVLNLAGLFRTCPSLVWLSIADNQLDDRSTAEPIDGRTSNSLWTIILANNRLERMDFVQDMTELRRLHLKGNRIESMMTENGQNLLGRLRLLTHLDLSCNRIRRLKDEMFVHLRNKIEYIDLSGNPYDIQLDSVLNEFI